MTLLWYNNNRTVVDFHGCLLFLVNQTPYRVEWNGPLSVLSKYKLVSFCTFFFPQYRCAGHSAMNKDKSAIKQKQRQQIEEDNAALNWRASTHLLNLARDKRPTSPITSPVVSPRNNPSTTKFTAKSNQTLLRSMSNSSSLTL